MSAPAATASIAGPAGLASRLRGPVLMSFLDQGFNSLGSLILAGALIVLTDPATYGAFAFVFTIVLVAASIQYGAIGIPLLVHTKHLADEDRREAIAILHGLDLRLRLAAALATGAAAGVLAGDLPAGVSAGAFCFTYLWRETARNTHYAMGNPARAAWLSGIALAGFAPLYGLCLKISLTLHAPFVAFAAATGIALAVHGRDAAGSLRNSAALLSDYRARFKGTGWTLSTSAANEVQTRLHVFVIQFLRGVDQLGILEAGRILVSPLFLIVSAWQRVGQPQMAGMIASGKMDAARRLALTGAAMITGVALAYCLAIYLAWGLIERLLFSSFADIAPYVTGWAGYSTLLLVNWSLVVFLNAAARFRVVAFVTLAAASATAALLFVMALDVPLITALCVLGAVQAGTLAILLRMVFTTATSKAQS